MDAHEQLAVEIARRVAVGGAMLSGRSRIDRWIDEGGELRGRYL